MRRHLVVAVAAAAALTGSAAVCGAPVSESAPGTRLWVARFLEGGSSGDSAMAVSPAGGTWRNAYGIWEDGTQPGCMAPLSRGQRITFAVVNVAPVADAPGSPVVVWIKCPSRPIPHYPIVTSPTASG